MRRRLLLALSIALLVSSQVFGQSKDHSANQLVLKGDFTPARAMKLVYGSYDPAYEVSQWMPNQAKSYPPAWPDKIEAHVVLDASYVESGTSRHLLVTSSLPQSTDPSEYTCHSCGTLIGMILFARELGGWRVEASDLQFGYLGEFGLPPTISLQPVGPERYGLFIPAFFGSTGVALNSITIVIPRGGAFLKVFEEQIAGSSDYGCSGTAAEERVNECVEYDGAFDLAPDSHGEYYDLLLTRRVYRSFSNKDPVNTTVTRYRFNGMNYAPVGKPSTAALKSPN